MVLVRFTRLARLSWRERARLVEACSMQQAADATPQKDYVSDTVYSCRYHAAQNPLHMNYVAALNGFCPIPLDTPFSYLDLGCATGLNVSLMADMFPQGRFYGVDFNAEHIARARRRAEDGGLSNAAFHVTHFSELSALDVEPMDFIAMYGTFSWISQELQRTVLDFVARTLKPGGRFLVHYATLPGKAQPPTMWHLVREITRDMSGGSLARVNKGIDVLREMREGNAAFFQQNPLAAAREKAIAGQAIDYLAHEILNEHTGPIYHAQLARGLKEKGLAFGGNADLVQEHFQLGVPARFHALVQAETDRIAQETLKDFITNNGIRVDIYVKGRPASSQLALLTDMVFGDPGLREPELPAGIPFNAASPVLQRVHAVLEQRAMRLSDMIALPELREFPAQQIAWAVQSLVAATMAWPFLEPVALDTSRAARKGPAQPATPFVRSLIGGAGVHVALALPSRRWGSAYPMPWLQGLCLKAWLGDGREAKEETVWRTMREQGAQSISFQGESLHSPQETVQVICAELENLRTNILPRLYALGIVE